MSRTERCCDEPSRSEAKRAGLLSSALFAVELATTEDETVLKLHGELDLATRQAFLNALGRIADNTARVVLDLSNLTFIDAGSIGIILRFRLLAESKGNAVALRSPHPQLFRILELTGLSFDGPAPPIGPLLPSRTYEHAI